MTGASHERRFKTRSVAGTLSIAERIAEMLLPTPRMVILRGDLGVGKTTLVKGIAATLGAAEAEEVTSPTFTLVHEYAGPNVKIYHLDLYRLETERDLASLGVEEMITEPDALVLVEWGEKFASTLAFATGDVAIEDLGGNERLITVSVR